MPLAITTKIAQEIKGVAYAPDDSFTVASGCTCSSASRIYEVHDRARRAHRPDTGTVALRAPHVALPLGLVLYFTAVPRADGAGRRSARRRRPRVVGVARAPREIGLLIENPFRRSLQLTQCTDAPGREIDETLALLHRRPSLPIIPLAPRPKRKKRKKKVPPPRTWPAPPLLPVIMYSEWGLPHSGRPSRSRTATDGDGAVVRTLNAL